MTTSAATPDRSRLPPRPAATLLLLRDGATGPEVFLLQRTHQAAFLGGAHVFPGGALDAGDGDPRVLERVAGMTEAQANARLGTESGALAYWVAAIRECFEEAGILLAVPEAGGDLDAERAAHLMQYRAGLHAGELTLHQFLERERLLLRGDALGYIGHWITAPGRARRFDTRFFCARAPAHQPGAHDGTELIDSVWLNPQEALRREASGAMQLVFATRSTLADIQRFTHAAEAIEHARRCEVETNRACWALGADGQPALFRRRDPQYFEIHWSDPEECGRSSVALAPGMPKRLDEWVTRIIAPNPGVMTGPGTNTYLVGREELAVIDPGPAVASHIDAVLQAGAGRIRWVLCTHTHIDHSPAARVIAESTGATLLGRRAPAGSTQDLTFVPDRVLAHGERLELGGFALRVLHTPGHASNHLCYLLEQTRMLFTGDHVMQGSTVVINPPDGNMRAYLGSLDALLHEDIAILAPGHGYLIGDPHREVRRLIGHRLAREQRVLDALARHPGGGPDQLVLDVYADVPHKLHRVALRSLQAHLDKLVADGRARSMDRGYWPAEPAA